MAAKTSPILCAADRLFRRATADLSRPTFQQSTSELPVVSEREVDTLKTRRDLQSEVSSLAEVHLHDGESLESALRRFKVQCASIGWHTLLDASSTEHARRT